MVNNVITIATNKSNITIYKSMNAMQELLPGHKFIRVHKSFYIAIDKVQSVKGNEIIVKLKGGDKNIPIGITFKENVLNQLVIN